MENTQETNIFLVMEATKNANDIIDRSYTYVTFLAGESDYVKGVVCLAKALRKVKAAYPLVVAVLSDVPQDHRNLLLKHGCLIRKIDPLAPPLDDKESPFVRPCFVINYSKLRLRKFVEYKRMIYLDADIQVLGNIDDLFELPSGHFYGVVDCLCQMDGRRCAGAVKWPEALGDEPEYYFNGGMFVLEPCIDTYTRLMNTLAVTPPTAFAEQDFLSFFFKKISKPLHPRYNLLVAMLWRHPDYFELDDLKVVHFCVAGSKPWKYTGKEEHMDRADVKKLVHGWWDVYSVAS